MFELPYLFGGLIGLGSRLLDTDYKCTKPLPKKQNKYESQLKPLSGCSIRSVIASKTPLSSLDIPC